MPFPTPQGTQASIAAMLNALTTRGDTPELWTYAHGAELSTTDYRIKRLWDVPRDRSLRSGPSLSKVLLDIQLAARLAASRSSALPLIAHHVEAAAACWSSRRPFVFFAHTDLGAELPTYASPSLAGPLHFIGTQAERTLLQSATSVAAISPLLADTLQTAHGRRAHYVPTPWSVRTPCTTAQRHEARTSFGLARDQPVLLYAGNLDAYQGWQDVVEAIAVLRRWQPHICLMVATQSAPDALRRFAHEQGVANRICLAPLANERDRQRCHAAADLCIVPRRVPGGLPIKLLEGLSHGVPIVTQRRAIAGLPLAACVSIVDDDSRSAIAARVRQLLEHRDQQLQQIASGSAYLREHHSPAKFFAAFDRVCGDT